MANLRIEKRNNSLPAVLTPNTLYIIKTGFTVSLYVSDETGTNAYTTDTVAGSTDNAPHAFLTMGAIDG